MVFLVTEVCVQYSSGVPCDRSVRPVLRYFSLRRKYNVQCTNVPHDGNVCNTPVLLSDVELSRVLFNMSEMCRIVFSSNVPCGTTDKVFEYCSF